MERLNDRTADLAKNTSRRWTTIACLVTNIQVAAARRDPVGAFTLLFAAGLARAMRSHRALGGGEFTVRTNNALRTHRRI